jgi:hypothetical protein
MEPERKIEKWLKAYAKKRRTQAGEPFKLHPTTRQLLQSEAARDKPKPEDGDESVSLWEVIRQRWAILLSFAACIFLVGIILLPVTYSAKKKAATLASASGAREIGSAANAPAAASEDKFQASPSEKKDLDLAHNGLAGEESNTVLLADDRKALVNRDTEYATNNAPSPTVAMTVTPSAAPGLSESIQATPLEVSPAAPATPPAPIVASENFAVAKQSESSTSVTNSLKGSYARLPAGPPLVAAAAPSGSFPNSQLAKQSLGTVPAAAPPAEMPSSEQSAMTSWGQSQLQSEPGTVASLKLEEMQNVFKNSIEPSQASPVLSNFQVQQNGNAIRLVDQDGSFYDGSLELANQTVEKSEDQAALNANTRAVQNAVTVVAGLPSQQITAAQDALQLAQNYFFHVYGTNRTVKQTVSFTGRLTMNFVPTSNAKLSFRLTDNTANTGGGGFGGGGGGGGGGVTVGGVLDRTKSEATNQMTQLPWSSLRITGTAVINQTNRIQVDAAPVLPNKN